MDALHARLRAALAGQVDPLALYETLLQTYLFAGFPAALESLRLLRATLKESGNPWQPPPREAYDVEVFRGRGEPLYRQVYATNHAALREAVEKFSADMFEYMIVEGYGKILSRPGLTGPQRELTTITALAALGWERQTISHARGALHLGATVDAVYDAIALSEECSSHERADAMREAVRPHILQDGA